MIHKTLQRRQMIATLTLNKVRQHFRCHTIVELFWLNIAAGQGGAQFEANRIDLELSFDWLRR